ncbi:hypothetical protein GOP47_0023061 [Adiantum capillus-veneris]|uniref:Uncharacterized protein n=1 Tax=Adiantum capillus-veneris TaxID=13818 RepID=A0A9D4U708_ADICA|nr:hypothetical protein GOP47_0023061 [Adiantum capillus-veneris]
MANGNSQFALFVFRQLLQVLGVKRASSGTAAINSYSTYGFLPSSAFNRAAASRKCGRRRMNVRAVAGFPSVSPPLVAPSSHWGMWSVLLCIAAFGIWSEKATHWGSVLSGALVSTLVGLAASNMGLIATDAPAYSIVNQYLLPLSVPLLLLKADLRVVVVSTGRLLLAFCLGSGKLLFLAYNYLRFAMPLFHNFVLMPEH